MKRSLLFLLSIAIFGTSCVSIPLSASYSGPPHRPADLEKYYEVEGGYTILSTARIRSVDEYQVERIEIDTPYGEVTIDYFKRQEVSDSLVFVFPVLGGSNAFSNHFADYFAQRGIETAIVHRDSDFKKPENYPHIEEVLRRNVLRDRIAIDFFEREYGKRRFGTFGISRGAINASITAGVDKRLQYNVFALGGADLVNLFRDSEEGGIQRYRRKVIKKQEIAEDRFYSYLRQTLRTDPKFVAGHIDARNALLFLSVFDTSVPFQYGLKLRARMGQPRTIFLLSGHYTALAFTQFVRVMPPTDEFCVFPLDYVESESLSFYREKLGAQRWSLRSMVVRTMQAPVQFVADVVRMLVD